MAIVNKSKIFITDSVGHRQLKQIESFDPSQEGGMSNVLDLEGNVIGSARQGGGWTITLVTRLKAGVPDEVDWNGLREDDEFFVMERQLIGNKREQYLDCRVVTCPVANDNQGNATRTVTINAERFAEV